MIDLQKFCSTDERRPHICKPYSRGEYTYATNGHMLVRVGRSVDFSENEQAPDCESIIKLCQPIYFQPLDNITMPEPIFRDVKCRCDEEPEHDCPSCDCFEGSGDDCDFCHGKGIYTQVDYGCVAIGKVCFDPKYIALIKDLPSAVIQNPIPSHPCLFKFDGGIGVVMPLRGEGGKGWQVYREEVPK